MFRMLLCLCIAVVFGTAADAGSCANGKCSVRHHAAKAEYESHSTKTVTRSKIERAVRGGSHGAHKASHSRKVRRELRTIHGSHGG